MGSKPVVLGDWIVGAVVGSRLSVAGGERTIELSREVTRQMWIERSGDSEHSGGVIQPRTHSGFSSLTSRARLTGVGPKPIDEASEFLAEGLRCHSACQLEQLLLHRSEFDTS